MSLSNAQRGGFEDRLSRIKKGGANTMGEVHIGPRDEVRAGKGKATNTVRMKKKKNKDVALGEGSGSVLVPAALILGGMSMFVGQAAAFHLFDVGGLVPVNLPEAAIAAVPYAHFIIGGILALMFSWTFRLSTLARRLAVVAGFFAVIHFQSDLMQRFPGLYTNFFTEAYVVEALGSAKA